MLDKLLSKNEVNIGRQREFDYLRGAVMVFIFIVHAFQGTISDEDNILRVIYIFISMLGAALFIFMLGFGFVYSRQNTPVNLVKNGFRFILYQYLNNLFAVLALILPYPFMRLAMTSEDKELLQMAVEINIQYINIFFISGIIYLVLALLIWLKAKMPVYVVTGIILSVLAPFLCGRNVDVPVVGYILQLLTGEADHVTFISLYYLPYALMGAGFGALFRRVQDKKKFYQIIIPICFVIVAAWWVLIFMRYGMDIISLREDMGLSYLHPDLWRLTASIAHIILFAGLIYLIAGENLVHEPKSIISRQLLYYNKHISKYYAVHLPVYFLLFGFHGYHSFTVIQCWGLALLCAVITEMIVRGYNDVYDRCKSKKFHQA